MAASRSSQARDSGADLTAAPRSVRGPIPWHGRPRLAPNRRLLMTHVCSVRGRRRRSRCDSGRRPTPEPSSAGEPRPAPCDGALRLAARLPVSDFASASRAPRTRSLRSATIEKRKRDSLPRCDPRRAWIALLRDQPRTATVRASADANMRVSVLQRSAYLTAVTGYPASSAAGEEVVTARLKADAERRLGQ